MINQIHEKINKDLQHDEEFWYNDGRGRTKIHLLNLKKWLNKNGFFRYNFTDDRISFVRLQNNLLEEVKVHDIRNFVLDKLEEWEEVGIYNLVAENSKFKTEYLSHLKLLEPKFIKDDKHTSWCFYSNTAVKITSEKIECVDYKDLEGVIWKSEKLNREFKKSDFEKCDFNIFLKNLSNQDGERYRALLSAIGYMLHRYKSPSTTKVVILNDEVISDEPAGGTGKTLVFQAMGKIRPIVIINGKNFNDNKSFVWQRVNLDTAIVVLDDIPNGFKFMNLFSIITTGWPIEKKNRGEIYLPPELSPKMGIPTNHSIRGRTDSFRRRKFELEINAHYSASHQPVDEFGKEFWTSDWSEDDWLCFDNVMMYAVQQFIKDGFITPKFVNLEKKQLIADTSEDFTEWAEFHLENNRMYKRNAMYKRFKEENPETYIKDAKMFYRWMRIWGEYNGWKTADAGQGKMYIQYGDEVVSHVDNDNDLPF